MPDEQLRRVLGDDLEEREHEPARQDAPGEEPPGTTTPGTTQPGTSQPTVPGATGVVPPTAVTGAALAGPIPSSTAPDPAAPSSGVGPAASPDGAGDRPDAGDEDEPVRTPTSPPGLRRAACGWPDLDQPRLRIDYLAPTAAVSGADHLRRVIDVGSSTTRGARVVEVPRGNEVIGVLVSASDRMLETAVVRRSALVFVTVGDDIAAGSPEFQTVIDLTVLALRNAPR